MGLSGHTSGTSNSFYILNLHNLLETAKSLSFCLLHVVPFTCPKLTSFMTQKVLPNSSWNSACFWGFKYLLTKYYIPGTPAKHFAWIISFIYINNPPKQILLWSLFYQWGSQNSETWVACLRFHNWSVSGPGFEPRLLTSEPVHLPISSSASQY